MVQGQIVLHKSINPKKHIPFEDGKWSLVGAGSCCLWQLESKRMNEGGDTPGSLSGSPLLTAPPPQFLRAAPSHSSPLPMDVRPRQPDVGLPRGIHRLHGMDGAGVPPRNHRWHHSWVPLGWDPGLTGCKPGWAGLPAKNNIGDVIQPETLGIQPRGLLGTPGFAFLRKKEGKEQSPLVQLQ